jgi:hypothetical protein
MRREIEQIEDELTEEQLAVMLAGLLDSGDELFDDTALDEADLK